MLSLLMASIVTFLLNVPFGYWRAHVPKFSRDWFLAVHLPVPLIIALRFLANIGWALYTFPVLVGAFFLGQMAGGKIYSIISRRGATTSRCLFKDLHSLLE